MKASDAKTKLHALASPQGAAASARFFKTGPGEYSEGDIFLGVRVPDIRKVAREFKTLSLSEVKLLLTSPHHEERQLALLILVLGVAKGTDIHRKSVYDFYLNHTRYVNNWDLVDCSAPPLVGGYLVDKSRKPLVALAKSPNLWERRIAIVSTQHLIRLGQLEDTLTLAEILLADTEDLIHKATGWMLREVGEQDEATLVAFLNVHGANMPRTMLRYAIEHFSPEKRRAFLDKERPAPGKVVKQDRSLRVRGGNSKEAEKGCLAERIHHCLSNQDNIVSKKMFGGIGFLLNGHMLVGEWKGSLIVRVGPDQYEAAMRERHVEEFDITGKSMKGWVMVRPEGVADHLQCREWIERALDFVGTLPGKEGR